MNASRALRTLAFLVAGVPVAALALGFLIAGWVAVAVLAITPLVIPALVAFRAAVGGVAWLDAELAHALLGTSARPRLRSPGGRGFWRSGLNVLRDESFWRQQSYLLLRLSIGFGLAVAEVSLLAASLGALTAPIWYRWDNGEVVGGWVDSLPRALLGLPAGVLGLVAALALLGWIGTASRRVVDGLLGGAERPARAPDVLRADRRRALLVHAVATAVLNAFAIVIWAAAGGGYFWPEWTLIALGLPLAVHAWVVFVAERPAFAARRGRAALAMHAGIAVALAVFFVLVWAVTGAGYFWPIWPILAFVFLFAVHATVELLRRGSRISELEATRAAAVDQQETDLARIERDLHDGAQARLVALGMSIGMAEQKLASDPEAAQELLAEARRGTREALEELRTLARGIHPPVLADRGLAAAIGALADRTPLRVNVAVDLQRRPPRPVETAAYFVAAEGLANAGKHARATRVDIAVREDGDRLVIEIVDDGNGGADPGGAGLRGLARRVEALDGRLEVVSPAGGPTIIRAVMPCASS